MKHLTYHKTILPAMHYDTRDIFDETKADNIERLWIERENMIKDIINTPHFVALEMSNSYGGRFYLHKSRRNGVKWQFSRLCKDGFFNGHSDIEQNDGRKKREIMHEIIAQCHGRNIDIEFTTAE